jgi:hypothetical protein
MPEAGVAYNPLLDDADGTESAAPTAGWKRTRISLLVFTGFAGATAVFNVYGNWPQGIYDEVEAPSAVSLRGITSINGSMPVSFAGQQYNNFCYAFTGGTCAVDPCKDFRKASCVQGKCICTTEDESKPSCTGVDGTCQSGVYEKVAEAVSFTNVYWPSQTLYMQKMSVFAQAATSSWTASLLGNSAQFDIHELPGRINGTDKKMYFVTSAKWTTFTMAMRPTTGTALSPFGLFTVNLDSKLLPYDPDGVVIHLCAMTKAGFAGNIMIESPGTLATLGLVTKAYIHTGSWLVYGSPLEDPGTGAYWTPSIPIPGLQAC